MNRQNVTYDELDERSGVNATTFKAWRTASKPQIEPLEATLGALGYDLIPIPRIKALPPEIAAELKPIAEKIGMAMPDVMAGIIQIATNIHARFDRPWVATPEYLANLPVPPAPRGKKRKEHAGSYSLFDV